MFKLFMGALCVFWAVTAALGFQGQIPSVFSFSSEMTNALRVGLATMTGLVALDAK